MNMKILDGTYKVEFTSSLGWFGAGVVSLEDGRVVGGDTSFRYEGTLSSISGVVTADIAVARHSGFQQSIFGDLDRFDLDLRGQVANGLGLLTGFVRGAPALRIKLRLEKQEALVIS